MSRLPYMLGLLACVVLAAPPAVAPKSVAIVFEGDNGGEVAPCG